MERPDLTQRLGIDIKTLRDFCAKWKIAEFSLFGSILGDNFTAASDVDILISFQDEARWNLFDFVTMREDLIGLLGREVDLLERTAIERSRNYIRRDSILRSARVVYAA
ncbi:MAG: nucleotidyltransferase domain-containing protein [Candidatus Eisenbacteria bacterium]|nr:nucleotidyltransferase domain-containing protein [Candidatus Eisenbacteria bacterium]